LRPAADRPSLRRILLARVLLPLVAIWLVGAAFTFLSTRKTMTAAFDHDLVDTALALASRVRTTGGATEIDLSSRALELLLYRKDEKLYYGIFRTDAKPVAGESGLPLPTEPPPLDQPRLYDARFRGTAARVAAVTIVPPGADEPVMVLAAETFHLRHDAEREIVVYALLPQLALLAVLALLLRESISKSLAPLDRLSTEIASRSANDMRPLAEDPPSLESHRIKVSVDDLMGRLDASLGAQKAFVGDAAHQLRTPLAGLKATGEYALRQADAAAWRAAIERMLASAETSTHLVNQLLALAQADGVTAQRRPAVGCDLVELARDRAMELAPAALKRGVEVEFEADVEPVTIHAIPALVSEIVANLVENAVRYTPAGGRVTVAVRESDRAAELRVTDTGPGIPEDEQARVFDRFYRGREAAPGGSGLGLAIVRAYARVMGASVAIESAPPRPGTTVSVRFVGAPPPG
jgi:two-component system sensor histidine kinase TctE